jgi:hypothetical protein
MNSKQKNSTLFIVLGLLLVFSYVFSIQKTVDLKSRLNALEKDKELMSGANENVFRLQQENKYLDAILKQKEVSIENSFQQTLLKKLTIFSKKTSIEIISFKQPHIYKNKNTVLMWYAFEVKGDFKSLLQLINTLERQQLGELISVHFEKKRNYRRNRDELIGLFYIQKLNQQQE